MAAPIPEGEKKLYALKHDLQEQIDNIKERLKNLDANERLGRLETLTNRHTEDIRILGQVHNNNPALRNLIHGYIQETGSMIHEYVQKTVTGELVTQMAKTAMKKEYAEKKARKEVKELEERLKGEAEKRNRTFEKRVKKEVERRMAALGEPGKGRGYVGGAEEGVEDNMSE